MWDELQQRLARLSTHSNHLLFPKCGHFLQREAPQQVAAAVASMVERVRNTS
jgi:pimeloyl-ACP methyl ester carboxylesterase